MTNIHTMNFRIFIGGGKTDVLKICLSIMIVVIHTVDYGSFSPILRCAVPFFFMISATFFWNKVQQQNESGQKKLYLRKFVIRNLKLYLFWFIVLAPITFSIKEYFADGIFLGIINLIRDFLFSSTFRGSWFIMSLILGTTMIFYLSKKLSNIFLLIISVVFYLFCVLTSNYDKLLQHNSIFNDLISSYIFIFSSPFNSFPASLVWVVISKIIVEKILYIKNWTLVLMSIISAVLLAFEYVIINKFDLSSNDDCYLMLLPLCVCLYMLFCRFDIGLPEIKNLRKISTIVYCSHISISVVISYMLRHLFGIGGVMIFLMTATVCIGISFIIIRMEKYSCFKWLKYSY